MSKLESEKQKSWRFPAEGFQGSRCRGWFFAVCSWEVESMWLGGGAVGL